MTKSWANEIKALINKDTHYTTYYSSKNEELRVRVFSFIDAEVTQETCIIAKQKVSSLLKILEDKGIIPDYRIEHKRYQGFINDIDVILY